MICVSHKAAGIPLLDCIAIPLTKGHEAIIDRADYERECTVGFNDGFVWTGRICDRHWHASVKPHTVYATCNVTINGQQRELRLHRCVTNAKAGEVPDHEDGNGLNNRRSNLRIGTHIDNCHNWHKPSGAIPFRGVALHKKTGKFESFLKVGGKKHHCGLFATAEEAARARDAKAQELHGSFARLNFDRLRAADLSEADLTPIRDDFWAVLSSAPCEVSALRDALVAGKVDGSTYHGECACLVGTIANARHCDVYQIPTLKPNSSRPAECFFLSINRGDTPEKNQHAKLAVEWIDMWLANIRQLVGGAA